MNFFEHQDRARRMTWRLVGLLILAMTLVVGAVFVSLVFFEGLWGMTRRGLFLRWWQPGLFWMVTLGTVGLVGIAAWVRMRALDAGGGSVALSLGATQVLPGRAQGRDRVLLNVVEEMAIASGTPVPFVFVLREESGINAFAAAVSSQDAAIVLTQGALEGLSREELQGVVGHEFGHLLNGDTRLNMRLVGLLYGLTVMGQGGKRLLRVGLGPRRSLTSWTRRQGGPLMLLGILLWGIGAFGASLARLIKAAVSRQREYLADASAVQFARNQEGLIGALKKIGALQGRDRIHSPGAEEFSHLFFAEAFERGWSARLFATHPPLIERIRRMEPGFSGRFPRLESPVASRSSDAAAQSSAAVPAAPSASSLTSSLDAAVLAAPLSTSAIHTGQRFALSASSVVTRVGAPTAEDLRWGNEALHAMPEALRGAAAEPFDAIAALFALLIQEEPELRERQEAIIRRLAPRGGAARARVMLQHTQELDPRLRLPLVETLVPSLRRLSQPQREVVMTCVQALADADGERSVFEHVLRRMLVRRLLGQGAQGAAPSPILSARPLGAVFSVVLSALAWVGQDNPLEVGAAFRAARERLPPAIRARVNLLDREDCTFVAVDKALDRMGGAVSHIKRAFVDACAHCVASDGQVTVEEAELLRGVAEAVRCPIPPLLPRFAPPPVASSDGSGRVPSELSSEQR